MPDRIDLDDGSEGDLEEALRQLQRRSQPAKQEPEEKEAAPRADLQEAVREIAAQQKAAAARKPRRPGAYLWMLWALLGATVVAGAVVAAIRLRPEPLPPPATSATAAVTGFWNAVIAGKYQAATVYCPDLVQRYGSRKQAAERLKEQFSANPPVRLSQVGEPEPLPDSQDLRVSYQVDLRGGTPRTGDAIVRNTNDPAVGYIIVAGI